MIKEILTPVSKDKTAEGLLKNPPRIILVFDYQSASHASEVMNLRSATAGLIYFSNLYTDENRPLVCCFAGQHSEGDISGSDATKKQFLKCGIPEDHIVVRKNTITTNTDISELHALMIARNINGPAAIVTTDWHIPRTEQELVNHFNKHLENADIPQKIPIIYVIGPSSPEIQQLTFNESNMEKAKELKQQIAELVNVVPSGGITEAIAYRLSNIKDANKI